MLGYEPGNTYAHRLDPRSKLLFQVAFAAAAFAHTTPRGLVVLGIVSWVALAASGTGLVETLWTYRFVAPFLVGAPLISTLTLGAPWIDPSAAVEPGLASVRILLVLLVSAGYVRTTPIRESRAAIQRTVPGRPGQFLGIGVALVGRFLPLVRRDLLAIRQAEAARLGTERPLRAQIASLTASGLNRSFARADRLTVALQARCFAWNPTLPELRFTRVDVPVLAGSVGLVVAALFPVAGGLLL